MPTDNSSGAGQFSPLNTTIQRTKIISNKAPVTVYWLPLSGRTVIAHFRESVLANRPVQLLLPHGIPRFDRRGYVLPECEHLLQFAGRQLAVSVVRIRLHPHRVLAAGRDERQRAGDRLAGQILANRQIEEGLGQPEYQIAGGIVLAELVPQVVEQLHALEGQLGVQGALNATCDMLPLLVIGFGSGRFT